MSAEEIAAAKQEIRRLTLPLDLRRTRRLRPDPLGPVTDLRRTIRAKPAPGRRNPDDRPQPPQTRAAAAGGAVRHLRLDVALRADPAAFPARGDQRPRPRARLPVRHAADQHHPPVARIATRRWRSRPSPTSCPTGPAAPASARRWRRFNRRWAKRVLAQGAVVLLITDGLDRPRDAGQPASWPRTWTGCTAPAAG